MAYRDKSQGFAFVYVDIKKLLEKNSKRATSPPEATPPKSNVVNLNRDPKPAPPRPENELPKDFQLPVSQFTPIQPEVTQAPAQDVKERNEAIKKIKSNLDRLQSLHHRLHTVLDDLNQVSRWKKKKK